MYKKIVLILSALIVLSLPYQQQYAQAVILSKVATTGVKKAVKEVIKESAFDAAVNIFLDEAYSMALEEKQKYQAQQDYELFCGKKMPDLITCEKPMQAKVNLTSQDKANIGQQAELELEKLINGGKGFTRWQKFLDFILPIWLVSVSFTAITYALDPEVKSLFNEAGYNALVALGLIKPVTSNEIEPFPSVQLPPKPTQDSTVGNVIMQSFPATTDTLRGWNFFNFPAMTGRNVVAQIDLYNHQFNYSTIAFALYGSSISLNTIDGVPSFKVGEKWLGTGTSLRELTISINGEPSQTIPHVKTSGYYNFNSINSDISILTKKINSVKTRTPYEVNGNWYTDTLYNTVDGDILHFQTKSQVAPTLYMDSINTFIADIYEKSYPTSNMNLTVYSNISPKKVILPPVYEEIETELDLVTGSKYEKDGQIALIPPSAIPHIQTSTGVQLTPEIDEETGEKKFTTPTGESVPEDDITVGEPNVQDNPSPSPNTVTPPATQTNPNPEPIPLTPVTPTPTPTPTPPLETEPPKFPEGESCSEGLKLPKIKPLTQSVTTAFPFSIPFDLYKGFQALFSEIGTEKPSFNLVIGDSIDWKITIPDYFDSWKTFSDGILIFVFDVGLIYAIYRFMSGGGS